MTLVENLDKLEKLLAVKDKLAEDTKKNNADIDNLKKTISDQMMDSEITGLKHGNFNYSLVDKVKYSKKAGNDEHFFTVLRENDLGSIIKETVNAQTLQGAIKNVVAENDGELPEEFAEVINVYEYLDINRRKA